MLITERDVTMDEITDRLYARPPRRSLFEEVPGHVGQAVRFAVAAAEQKRQRLGRQILHRVLRGRGRQDVRLAGIAHDTIGRQAHPAAGGDDAAAPIAEDVAVGRDRGRPALVPEVIAKSILDSR